MGRSSECPSPGLFAKGPRPRAPPPPPPALCPPRRTEQRRDADGTVKRRRDVLAKTREKAAPMYPKKYMALPASCRARDSIVL